jgi:hypothetical protein
MSSAVFVSSTGRWINNNTGKNLPGPANYSPAKITKQSFHCNFFNVYFFIFYFDLFLIFSYDCEDNNERKWV